MSFAAIETSADRGEPIRLFLFRYGDPDDCTLAFTDAEQPVGPVEGDRNGVMVTFQPVAIAHEAISASGSLDRAGLEISTSDDNPLVDLFKLYPPSSIVTVAIWQGHANDPDGQFLPAWFGRIVGFSTERNNAVFAGEPVATSMRRPGLRRRWQHGCPHVLYGPQCKANKEAATTDQVVLGVSGAIVALGEAWASASRRPKYQGGIAEWLLNDGRKEIRTILRVQMDGSLILAGRASGLTPGMTISLSLGCNHRLGVAPQIDGDCKPLFDNIRNFGGQPWIPTKNPIGLVNNFY